MTRTQIDSDTTEVAAMRTSVAKLILISLIVYFIGISDSFHMQRIMTVQSSLNSGLAHQPGFFNFRFGVRNGRSMLRCDGTIGVSPIVEIPSNTASRQNTADNSTAILDQAISRCRQSISRNASNEEPWYFLGLLLLQRGGNEAEALDALLRAAALRPDREETWLRIAALHEAAGRSGLAAPAYMAALRADPNSWRSLTGLGALLERSGDASAAAALQAYTRAAALAPAAAVGAHAGAVRLLRRAGRAEDARAAAARFLEAFPDRSVALCAMGECLQVRVRLSLPTFWPAYTRTCACV
jgi:tetratricopeptide (TPR) repeat protein